MKRELKRVTKDNFGNITYTYNDFTDTKFFKSEILLRNVLAKKSEIKKAVELFIEKHNITDYQLHYNASFDVMLITYN